MSYFTSLVPRTKEQFGTSLVDLT